MEHDTSRCILKDMEGDGDVMDPFGSRFLLFAKAEERDIAGKDEQKGVFAHRCPKLDHFFYFIPVVAFFFLFNLYFFSSAK